MREIKFRAKRIDNGEWAESASVSKSEKLFGEVLWFIGAGQPAEQWVDDRGNLIAVSTTGECLFYACDPKTLGQFTGLTDKNGKKIFEGDIVQYSIEEDQAVFFGAVKFGEFNPDGGALLNTNIGFYVELVDLEGKRTYMRKDIGYWVKFRGIEVIGNIHDNPEFLRGEEDG